MSSASTKASVRAASNGERLTELKTRLERLARREPVTAQDVVRARVRAEAQAQALAAARDRLESMRRSAAMRHESYAELLAMVGRPECAEREREAARREYALIENDTESLQVHREMAGVLGDESSAPVSTGDEVTRLRQGLAALLAWTGPADIDEVDRRHAWCRSIVEQCGRREWRGWLQAVCLTGASMLPDVRGVGITVASASGVEFAATSDDWTSRVHQLELVAGEGPSTSAREQGRPTAVDDLAAEREAWQGYASASADHDVRGVCALPLRVRGVSVGSLTLYYRTSLSECASADLGDATAFADIASAAVLADIEQIRHGGPAGQELFVVHVAAGALVARLGILPDEADARLRAFAFSEGVRLEEAARRVLEGEEV